MSNDTYSGGPATDNYGVAQPPRELPPNEEEMRYDGPGYNAPAPERRGPPTYVRWIGGLLIAFVAVMLLCGGTTAVLAAIALNSTPATANIDKSFSVSGVPTLVINGAAGRIHVNSGGDGQITVHVTKRVQALTRGQAQNTLDAINVTMTQSGDTVNIQQDSSLDNGWFAFGIFRRTQVDITVTAPAHTNLSIIENAGALDVTGLTGKLSTQLNAGSATLSNMTLAKGSALHVNAGSLTMDGALQPDATLLVEVNAGSANLTLPRDTSAHLDATASAGSVNVTGWNVSQSRSAATMSMSGDLNPNPTGTITVQVSAGSVSINAG